MVLETDLYGNFLLSGYELGTARDWARLGLLYLQGGVWNGKRLLPEGFTNFVRTPAPAWSEPIYGGFFWLNRTAYWPIPRGRSAWALQRRGGRQTRLVERAAAANAGRPAGAT